MTFCGQFEDHQILFSEHHSVTELGEREKGKRKRMRERDREIEKKERERERESFSGPQNRCEMALARLMIQTHAPRTSTQI